MQDVREQLSKAHMHEKQKACDMLYLILSSVRFLARQGLALRGDHCSEESNLTQLLHLRSECNPEMLQWLVKHSNKHVSTENQNEMLQLMAHQVLKKILENMHQSPFLTLMVDETTDVNNNHTNIGTRQVNNIIVESAANSARYLAQGPPCKLHLANYTSTNEL